VAHARAHPETIALAAIETPRFPMIVSNPALRDALRRLLCRRIRRHYRATKAHRQQLVDLVVRAFTTTALAAAQA